MASVRAHVASRGGVSVTGWESWPDTASFDFRQHARK